jgi:hypothetical protein
MRAVHVRLHQRLGQHPNALPEEVHVRLGTVGLADQIEQVHAVDDHRVLLFGELLGRYSPRMARWSSMSLTGAYPWTVPRPCNPELHHVLGDYSFPGAYVAYHQERLQPFADRFTEHIEDMAERRLPHDP